MNVLPFLFKRLSGSALFLRLKGRLRRQLVLQAMHLAEVAPVRFVRSDHSGKRLNLLLPSINREDLYGGIATALMLWKRLIDEAPAGMRFRIVLFDRSPDKEALDRFPEYRLMMGDVDERPRFEIVDLARPDGRFLALGSGDRCIATAWWTAYIGLRLMEQQLSVFGMPSLPWAYMIQDFEPAFYNWSSRFALAESTYRMALNVAEDRLPTWALFNTDLLQDYFHRNGYRFWKEAIVSPRMHPGLRSHLSADGSPPATCRNRTILVYGRPGVPRNGFEILLEGLRLWAARPKNRRRGWRVVSAGEPHPDYELGNGLFMRSLGKLSIDRYAKLLSEAAVGIALMISPHPSYPPLEMAHFGLLTLTNGFDGKNLSTWHENIRSIQRLTPETLAEALEELLERFETSSNSGFYGKSHRPDYLSDACPFPFASELIADLSA
jgi:hypothetical protein